MLIKKTFIITLSSLFCFLLVGTAIAENREASHASYVFPDDNTPSMQMHTGHDMTSDSTETATQKDQKQKDDMNSRPVLCASKTQSKDCRDMIGT